VSYLANTSKVRLLEAVGVRKYRYHREHLSQPVYSKTIRVSYIVLPFVGMRRMKGPTKPIGLQPFIQPN